MIFNYLNLKAVFIINIFVHQSKIFVVNWLQWHQKLQHLFRGDLYNKWKCKKHAVPFSTNTVDCLIDLVIVSSFPGLSGLPCPCCPPRLPLLSSPPTTPALPESKTGQNPENPAEAENAIGDASAGLSALSKCQSHKTFFFFRRWRWE